MRRRAGGARPRNEALPVVACPGGGAAVNGSLYALPDVWPVVVELVIIGCSIPLEVVVAPCPAVDRIGAGIDVVVAVVPRIAETGGHRRCGARVSPVQPAERGRVQQQ